MGVFHGVVLILYPLMWILVKRSFGLFGWFSWEESRVFFINSKNAIDFISGILTGCVSFFQRVHIEYFSRNFFFFFNRNCLVCFMIHTFPRGVLGAFFINFWNIIYITPFSLPCTVLYNRTFFPKGSIGSEHMGKRGGSRRDDGGHTLLGQYQQHGALSQQSGELLLYFFVKSVFMSE